MPRTGKGPSRKLLGEGGVSKELLGDFKIEGSKGLQFLQDFLEVSFKFLYVNILKSVGMAFSQATGIPFPRNYRRNKSLIIKWFNDNIEEINKQKSNVILINYDSSSPVENEKIVSEDELSNKEKEDKIYTNQKDNDLFLSTLFQEDDNQYCDYFDDFFY